MKCPGQIVVFFLKMGAHNVGALQPVATPPPVTPLATQSVQLTLKGGVSACAAARHPES